MESVTDLLTEWLWLWLCWMGQWWLTVPTSLNKQQHTYTQQIQNNSNLISMLNSVIFLIVTAWRSSYSFFFLFLLLFRVFLIRLGFKLSVGWIFDGAAFQSLPAHGWVWRGGMGRTKAIYFFLSFFFSCVGKHFLAIYLYIMIRNLLFI